MSKKHKDNPFDITTHKMLGDNILIEAIDISEICVEDGEPIDPEQYEDKGEWGKVISVGEGRQLENGTVVPPHVQSGDIVLFGKYSSYKTTIKGKDYLIVRDDDIMSKAIL